MSVQVLNRRNLPKGRIPRNAVYVGRPSKWGNPFVLDLDGDRAEVVRRYRLHVESNEDLMRSLPELRGKDLVCWCAPEACHADVLLELAQQEER